MRKKYVIPEIFTVNFPEPLAETMPMSDDDTNLGKENNIAFDDWEDEPIFKDLWAEDEEEEKKELW